MTKEAKLVAAQRIISEWTEYDTEIKTVMQGFKENKSTQSQGKPSNAEIVQGRWCWKVTIYLLFSLCAYLLYCVIFSLYFPSLLFVLLYFLTFSVFCYV